MVYTTQQNPCICIFSLAQRPQWARATSLSRLHEHTQTNHSRYDSSGRGIGSSQGPQPDNTTLKKKIQAQGGIQTRNLSKRSASDPPLRWARPQRSALLLYVSYPNLSLLTSTADLTKTRTSVTIFSPLTYQSTLLNIPEEQKHLLKNVSMCYIPNKM